MSNSRMSGLMPTFVREIWVLEYKRITFLVCRLSDYYRQDAQVQIRPTRLFIKRRVRIYF